MALRDGKGIGTWGSAFRIWYDRTQALAYWRETLYQGINMWDWTGLD
jgi:hypothetical protein